jgi:hypothetical protein
LITPKIKFRFRSKNSWFTVGSCGSRKKSKDIELLFLKAKRKKASNAKFICYSNRIGALKSKSFDGNVLLEVVIFTKQEYLVEQLTAKAQE